MHVCMHMYIVCSFFYSTNIRELNSFLYKLRDIIQSNDKNPYYKADLLHYS